MVSDESTGKLRLRDAQKEMTRERILSSAYRLFNDRGYSATTIDDVAADAAVNRGTVYLHFKNKGEILAALVAVTIGSIGPIFERLRHIGNRDEAIRIARDALALWEGHMGHVLSSMVDGSATDPSIGNLMRDYRKYTLDMGRDILEGYGVPTKMARARSSMVFGMAMETIARVTRGPNLGISKQATAEAFADLFIAATRIDCGADRPA